MVSYPTCGELFGEDGVAKDAEAQERRLNAMLVQLAWMGTAMKNERNRVGVPK